MEFLLVVTLLVLALGIASALLPFVAFRSTHPAVPPAPAWEDGSDQANFVDPRRVMLGVSLNPGRL